MKVITIFSLIQRKMKNIKHKEFEQNLTKKKKKKEEKGH